MGDLMVALLFLHTALTPLLEKNGICCWFGCWFWSMLVLVYLVLVYAGFGLCWFWSMLVFPAGFSSHCAASTSVISSGTSCHFSQLISSSQLIISAWQRRLRTKWKKKKKKKKKKTGRLPSRSIERASDIVWQHAEKPLDATYDLCEWFLICYLYGDRVLSVDIKALWSVHNYVAKSLWSHPISHQHFSEPNVIVHGFQNYSRNELNSQQKRPKWIKHQMNLWLHISLKFL